MKKLVFLIVMVVIAIGIKAQQTQPFTFTTNIGTGIAMNAPILTPFTWQVLGHYNVHERISIGIGSGLSFYEKTLIPLFADIRFTILKPRKLTPFLECGVGYSFAPDRNSIGGFYLNPSVGIQYSIHSHKKIFIALGYEQQKLERLKKQEQPLYTIEFAEKLNHHFLSIKMGVIF